MDLIKDFNNNFDNLFSQNQNFNYYFNNDITFNIEDLEEVKKFYSNLIDLINHNDFEYNNFGTSNLISLIKENQKNFLLFLISMKYPSLYGIIILNPSYLYDNNFKLLNMKKISEETLLKMNFNSKINFLVTDKKNYVKDPSLADIQLYDFHKEKLNLEDNFLILYYNFKEIKANPVVNKKRNYKNILTKSKNSDRSNISSNIKKKKIVYKNLKINKIETKFNTSLKTKILKTNKINSNITKNTINKLSVTSRLFKKNNDISNKKKKIKK